MAAQPFPVDPRLLRPLVILADELHFTRAAQRLHTTQSALSQQMARLELQVGTRLFDRPPLPVALTPAGAALVAGARPILAAIDAAVDEARGAAGVLPTEMTLGHVSSLGLHIVPELVAGFARAAGMPALRATQLNIEEQFEALEAGRIEAGLLAAGQDLDRSPLAFTFTPIARTPQLVAIPADHLNGRDLLRPGGPFPLVDVAALADEPWILPIGTVEADRAPQATMFQALCRRHGFTPRIAQQADSMDGLLGLATAGLGLVAVPWVVALREPAGLVLAELAGESVDTFVVTPQPPQGPVAELVDVCRAVFAAKGAAPADGGAAQAA